MEALPKPPQQNPTPDFSDTDVSGTAEKVTGKFQVAEAVVKMFPKAVFMFEPAGFEWAAIIVPSANLV